MGARLNPPEARPERPWLTVVVPVWNRAAAVGRCLESVLGQGFEGCDVVAVDDGSEDGTYETLAAIRHPALRALRRDRNGGTWAARGDGLAVARGDWIVFLDSDDELLPGALAFLAGRTQAALPDVGVVGVSYRDSRGRRWPDPPPPADPMGLERCLAWMDTVVRSDFLAAYRREVFDTVAPPAGFATGALFELEVLARWRKQVFPDVYARLNLDAENRQTGRGATFSAESFLRRAEAWAEVDEQVLSRFGDVLRRCAPHRLVATRGHAGLYALAAGHRVRGTRHMVRFLLRRPLSPGSWAFLLSGLIGPRALAATRRVLG